MASSIETNNRRVVPRWRSFREAIKTGELDPERQSLTTPFSGENFLHEREQEWLDHKEILFATDLVCAAYSVGPSKIAREAADFVLGHPGASDLSRQIARALIGIPEPITVSTSELSTDKDRSKRMHSELRQLKNRRHNEPRNAFVWMDCARLYTFLGLKDPANRAINIALALAPFDRFIARSACRFFLHFGNPERALKIIRTNQRTNHDPWLMAAELAVSSVVEKSPRSYKFAKSMLLSKNIDPLHLSELASAMGSLEMWDGKAKRAREFFAQAMEKPTENALAQCVWSAKQVGLNQIDARNLHIDNAFEASCWSAFQSLEWEKSLQFAKDWSVDEAFSSRPFLFGSSLASSLLKNPAEAERIAQAGLRTNPGNTGLLNNVAFSLVGQGHITKALQVLQGINIETISDTSRVCLLATTGLVHYRLGQPVEGKAFYEKAISSALENKLTGLRVRAMLYFAREECFVENPGADGLLKRAKEEAKKSTLAELVALSLLIEDEIRAAKHVPKV